MPDRAGLPFDDTADFEAAERGLIDAGDPVIRNDAGEVVWDNGSYSSFLTGDAPDTVHPALTALARGNLDAARSNGLTTSGDESQLASLFSVLQPGDPSFNVVEP